ncbi:GGDEF domain-containing protein [Desulfatibacillum aliphaticivorans]|uniref:GGDEF domain-containing protein n=1 Tax=Desulfatibacillum aliphaticivorans TaxID=218208 RepID=UPI0003F81311|nr:GGDEF domain-containing protein [Desulfatibacillum aliphaticivorans]
MKPSLRTSLLQSSDVLARYGGEEFCIMLPETPLDKATVLAERLRTAMAELRIDHPTEPVAFTVSIGAASWNNDADAVDQVLKQADEAPYTAKNQGRNQTVAWRDNPVVI